MGRGQRDWLAPNALLDGSSLLFILFIFICFSCPDLFIYWECAVTRILQNNNRPATQAQRRPTADLQVPPQTLRTLAPAHKRNASPPSLLYSTLPLAPPNCACAVSPHPSVKHTSVASNRIFAQLCSKYPPPFPRAPRVVLPDRALRLPTFCHSLWAANKPSAFSPKPLPPPISQYAQTHAHALRHSTQEVLLRDLLARTRAPFLPHATSACVGSRVQGLGPARGHTSPQCVLSAAN